MSACLFRVAMDRGGKFSACVAWWSDSISFVANLVLFVVDRLNASLCIVPEWGDVQSIFRRLVTSITCTLFIFVTRPIKTAFAYCSYVECVNKPGLYLMKMPLSRQKAQITSLNKSNPDSTSFIPLGKQKHSYYDLRVEMQR